MHVVDFRAVVPCVATVNAVALHVCIGISFLLQFFFLGGGGVNT